MGYGEDEKRKLSFEEIECVTILSRKVIAIKASETEQVGDRPFVSPAIEKNGKQNE